MGQFDKIEIEDISLLIDTVTYTNGDGYGWIYEGHVDQETRQPNGIGIQVSNDGDIFEGHWKNGKLNGSGRGIYGKRSYYIGNFKDNRFDGKGTECYIDGAIYQKGIWKNGHLID